MSQCHNIRSKSRLNDQTVLVISQFRTGVSLGPASLHVSFFEPLVFNCASCGWARERHERNPLIKEDIFGQECGVPSYQDGNINVFFPLLPFLHLIKEDMFGQECPVRATMMKIY